MVNGLKKLDEEIENLHQAVEKIMILDTDNISDDNQDILTTGFAGVMAAIAHALQPFNIDEAKFEQQVFEKLASYHTTSDGT